MVPSLAISPEIGVDTNVCHLQAHLFDLLSHMTYHPYGWWMPGRVPVEFVLAPFSQLKHDLNTHVMLKNYRAREEPLCTSALLHNSELSALLIRNISDLCFFVLGSNLTDKYTNLFSYFISRTLVSHSRSKKKSMYVKLWSSVGHSMTCRFVEA
jgi:hypothetical protein